MEATSVGEEEGLLSLDDLPSEVLLHILSFVGAGRSNEASRSLTDKSMRSGLLSCMLVNKRMYGLANDDMLWKSCCHRPSIGWITSKKEFETWKDWFTRIHPPPYFYDRLMWLEDTSSLITLVVHGTVVHNGTLAVNEFLLGAGRNSFGPCTVHISLFKNNGQTFEPGESGVFFLVFTGKEVCITLNPPSFVQDCKRPIVSLQEWESLDYRKLILRWRRERRAASKYVNPLTQVGQFYDNPDTFTNRSVFSSSLELQGTPVWWKSSSPPRGIYSKVRPWETSNFSNPRLTGGFYWNDSQKVIPHCYPDPTRNYDTGFYIRYRRFRSQPQLCCFLVEHGAIEFSCTFLAGRLRTVFRRDKSVQRDWFGEFAQKDSNDNLVLNREGFHSCLQAYFQHEPKVTGVRFVYRSNLLDRYSIIQSNQVVQHIVYTLSRQHITAPLSIVDVRARYLSDARQKEGQHNFNMPKNPKMTSEITSDLVAALQRRRAALGAASTPNTTTTTTRQNVEDNEDDEEYLSESDEEMLWPKKKHYPVSIFDESEDDIFGGDDIFASAPPPPPPRKTAIFGDDDEDPLFGPPQTQPPQHPPVRARRRRNRSDLFDTSSDEEDDDSDDDAEEEEVPCRERQPRVYEDIFAEGATLGAPLSSSKGLFDDDADALFGSDGGAGLFDDEAKPKKLDDVSEQTQNDDDDVDGEDAAPPPRPAIHHMTKDRPRGPKQRRPPSRTGSSEKLDRNEFPPTVQKAFFDDIHTDGLFEDFGPSGGGGGGERKNVGEDDNNNNHNNHNTDTNSNKNEKEDSPCGPSPVTPPRHSNSIFDDLNDGVGEC